METEPIRTGVVCPECKKPVANIEKVTPLVVWLRAQRASIDGSLMHPAWPCQNDLPPMPIPRRGDVLIRSLGLSSYELVDAVTYRHMVGGFTNFADAVAAARERKPRAIWQQNVDDRGRPLGPPLRLPDLPSSSVS